ncbi:MAG TPA: ClpXP protease specificity-enhancing factor SspB [Thermoanaerobaculia bacterium]|nr:ClpXP protease specificity-enhancing factor SspB [Thermoanaerobaculia bacterium]
MGETIDYQQRVQDALRGLVVRLLEEVAAEGLPGDHYFYLSFRTQHPGVAMPAVLRDLHPEELNIVLQHQFWDLDVGEEAFAVTLRFNGLRQRLTIPYAALTAFLDPVASFGLRFDGGPGQEGDGAEPGAAVEAPSPPAGEARGADVVRFDPKRKK